ncbi:hypothetical protein HMPREF9435_1046 [Gardnerella vaginalis 315-A]|uniref:phage distal tail protein n=1 Tax=Gardnerella vaginalis TaxID=2702 RepID=UPI00020D6FE0|nr:hypothetical protein [Gardnerella vaginalis]EGL14146.1 hypothetical protein HMPREF9435_1046 [Gardnerella vaginalis 315-A]
MKIWENSEYWVRINGTPISELGFMLGENGIKVAQPELKTSSVTVPGLSGALDTTLEDETMRAYMNPIEISVSLVAVGEPDEISAVRANLVRLQGRRGALSCYLTEGEWRGRWRISELEERGKSRHALVATLILLAQPWTYGRTTVVKLVNGVNKLNVLGNVPCFAKFSLNVDADSVKITNQNGLFLEFNIGAHMNGTLEIDTMPESRRCRINGNLLLPSIDSTFFSLRPGLNKLTVDGGSGTLTYSPLFLQ